MEHPVIINSNGKVERKDHRGIIAKYLASQAGRQQLAMSMTSPLRTRLNYNNIPNTTLAVNPLPASALPNNVIKGQRVTIPEFEIVSTPFIKIGEIKQRRFNIIPTKKSIVGTGYKKITIW